MGFKKSHPHYLVHFGSQLFVVGINFNLDFFQTIRLKIRKVSIKATGELFQKKGLQIDKLLARVYRHSFGIAAEGQSRTLGRVLFRSLTILLCLPLVDGNFGSLSSRQKFSTGTCSSSSSTPQRKYFYSVCTPYSPLPSFQSWTPTGRKLIAACNIGTWGLHSSEDPVPHVEWRLACDMPLQRRGGPWRGVL